MKLHSLSVKNFRSIQSLQWTPGSSFVCLLGKGDIGKSSILDAIEAVLTPRRMHFFDVDFFDCNVDLPIEILATVTDLPEEAFNETRLGAHLRGITASGEIVDEPTKDGEAAVTIRLSVEKDLDPRWEVITDRTEPKPIYSKDRALFGLVRLGAETDSQLTWGQYSPLARLSEERGGAASILTKAFRKAKETVRREPIKELNDTAGEVHREAVRLGAYATHEFQAGLDTQRLLSSLSGLALHASEIPLRMFGLGSRRLASLAIQKLSVSEGAIVLVDELEHGLEPHRIRHALKLLKNEVGTGQVILTTHSSTTIVELSTNDLRVVLRTGGTLNIKTPSPDLQAQLRRDPESFLSTRVIVCEGKTEVGLLRGLGAWWCGRHDGESLAYNGVCLSDGEGSSGYDVATRFAELGYSTCLFRDDDRDLSTAKRADLAARGVAIIEWPGKRSTEQQIFADISVNGVQELLNYVYSEFSEQSILAAVSHALGREVLSNRFTDWIDESHPEAAIRHAIAIAASETEDGKGRRGWFKRIDRGEELGVVVERELKTCLESDLSKTLEAVEAWAYGG